MDKLNLCFEPLLPEFLDIILKSFFRHYRKNYFLEISPRGLAEIVNFDNDYDILFKIGYQYGTIMAREDLLIMRNFNVSKPLSNKIISFRIISNTEWLIEKVIIEYNNLHQTDFSIERYEYDEVTFAFLKAEKINIADIFHLGCSFGFEAQKAREVGLIDW